MISYHMTVGTDVYRAPEQASSRAGYACDWWAFGVTLYYMDNRNDLTLFRPINPDDPEIPPSDILQNGRPVSIRDEDDKRTGVKKNEKGEIELKPINERAQGSRRFGTLISALVNFTPGSRPNPKDWPLSPDVLKFVDIVNGSKDGPLMVYDGQS